MSRPRRDEYYVLQPLSPSHVRMTKFVDDEPVRDSRYDVGRSSCQCYQSARGQCRHMIMWQVWNSCGRGRMKMRHDKDGTTWEPLPDSADSDEVML